MSSETVSLYFGLKDGETADLEIISQAAIDWVETLRALAQATNPGTDVKVELLTVDKGSNVFNTIVEWFDRNIEPTLERIEKGAEKAPPRSRKLLLGLASFTLVTAIPTYDAYFGDDFDENDRSTLKRIEEQTKSDPAVRTARRKLFRTLEREPSITSVAIKDEPTGTEISIVRSNHFAEEAGLFDPQQADVPERITRPVLEVVLVKPALLHTPRTWTFKPDGLPEFDAVMRDAKVLAAIQEKGFPAKMREGVRMTIRLEVKEVQIDGEWKLIRGGRSVMRVISPKLD